MILAVLAKASFGIAVYFPFFQNRVPGLVLGFATIDLFPGALFFLAWLRLR